MAGEGRQFEYDVFLSHSSKDKPVVRELAERLKKDGLKVWLDEWVIRPGDMIGLQIERGLEQSRTLILCMSKNAFESDWTTLERHTVMFRDPTNTQRRFIPLLLEDVKIPEMLKQYAYVNWKEKKDSEYQLLLGVCCVLNEKKKEDKITEPLLKKIISLGHTGAINSVILSGDGQRALSGSEDETIHLWDVETGNCVQVFEGHTGSVWSVGLSSDDHYVLSGSSDNTIRLWNIETSLCVKVLKEHTGPVYSVALSQDNRWILSGSFDKTIRLWNFEDGQCVKEFRGHSGPVYSVVLSTDGRYVLSGSSDKTMRVWDVKTGQCVKVFNGHKGTVLSVDLRSDGRLALSGSTDNTIRLWDMRSGRCVKVLEGHTNSVRSVIFSKDDRYVLSGSFDKTVRLWDIESGRCAMLFQGDMNRVLSVSLSKDGRRALSGSSDKTIQLWDVATRYCTRIIKGTYYVKSMILSGDGHRVLSGCTDNIIRLWDIETSRCIQVFEGHVGPISSLDWSLNGCFALSGSLDSTARLWEVASGRCVMVFKGHALPVHSAVLSNDSDFALSGSLDNTLRLWDVKTGRCLKIFKGHTDFVFGVVLSGDGRYALSGSKDKTVRLWDVKTGRCLKIFKGHTDAVISVALSKDGCFALSGSEDKTIRLWDIQKGHCAKVFEGHTGYIGCVVLSEDGHRALSGSIDSTVRLWDVETGRCIKVFEDHRSEILNVSFNKTNGLIFSSAANGIARLWLLDAAENAAISEPSQDTQYTNAKVVLVGETGVGKTGLSLRLCDNKWKPTESTHGMAVSQLKLGPDKKDNVEREVWLWDFAGQPDYRLINQLYIDETAMGIIVFDPQNDNPFNTISYWEKALRACKYDPAKLLVAGRCDRGGITISKKRFDEFVREHGFAGFLCTGAKTGEGCEELKSQIAKHVPWDKLTWTSTTKLFKALKDAILKLSEEKMPLVRLPELKQRLQLMLSQETIGEKELRTVVGLLQGQGIVQMLPFGDFVLLLPSWINCYASVVVRMAREHVDEMGVVAEQQILDRRLDYKGAERLSEADEKILLQAMVQTFLERSLCLREHTPAGTMLVFPSYFRRERPEMPDHPHVFVNYGFSGPLEEIYSTLVVRLSYSEGFKKDQLWKDAADFKTPGGKRVGLMMKEKGEGRAEIVVYFEPDVPDDTKVMFIKYVHEHLLGRGQDVTRVRSYVCPHCDTPLENRKAIQKRLEDGKKDILCVTCEKRVQLYDLIEEKFGSDEFLRRVHEMDEQAKIRLDNESLELILTGHAMAIAGQAGQIYRIVAEPDWGIDAEIEFKDDKGQASGKRVYLQLKSGDSYLYQRQRDEKEIFTIKKPRHAQYWTSHAYPVMLVVRTSDGRIRWMNVTEYLNQHGTDIKQIEFEGEVLDEFSLRRMRDKMVKGM